MSYKLRIRMASQDFTAVHQYPRVSTTVAVATQVTIAATIIQKQKLNSEGKEKNQLR
jgi:hypothetical protein